MMEKKPKTTTAAHSRRALFGEVEEAGRRAERDGNGKQSFGLLVAEFIGGQSGNAW
jgi:hypothetical protein